MDMSENTTTVTVKSDGDRLMIVCDRDESKFFVLDYDSYCSVARYYGWQPCKHGCETDGSVNCSHHKTHEFELSAEKFLWDNCVGESIDDPGWFID